MALSSSSSAQETNKIHNYKLVRSFFLAGFLTVNSGFALAVVPLNDQELDQKFLKADERITRVDVEQVYRQTQSKNIDQLLLTLIPIEGLSALTFILNDNERKQLINSTEFKFSNSFGELASYEFGSEPYSYRWAGNYDQIFDLPKFQNFYYNTFTGSYELDSNIKGRIDLDVSVYNDDRRTTFHRSRYVF